jgi:hypothetical protein
MKPDPDTDSCPMPPEPLEYRRPGTANALPSRTIAWVALSLGAATILALLPLWSYNKPLPLRLADYAGSCTLAQARLLVLVPSLAALAVNVSIARHASRSRWSILTLIAVALSIVAVLVAICWAVFLPGG